MKLSDLKYLLSYAFPIIFIISLRLGSSWAWLTVFVTFAVVPLLELFIKGNESNLQESEITTKADHLYFSLLLFINLPIIAYVLFAVFSLKTIQNYGWFELIGLIISLGIVLSSNGINVAHELGHKSSRVHQFAAKLLLIPSHYTHFTIEHNRGHHLFVGTPFDPATAKKGELLYSFWWRSSILGYLDAWKLEAKRLRGKQFNVFQNEMFLNSILTLAYPLFVYFFFGQYPMWIAIFAGIVAFLMLETINYIEHYGLKRALLENGRYERVEAFHSWNSNHFVGRLLLYELTRHSDHHYKSFKNYQILDHHDSSPQLPLGYPASMVIALIPFFWFKMMDPKIKVS